MKTSYYALHPNPGAAKPSIFGEVSGSKTSIFGGGALAGKESESIFGGKPKQEEAKADSPKVAAVPPPVPIVPSQPTPADAGEAASRAKANSVIANVFKSGGGFDPSKFGGPAFKPAAPVIPGEAGPFGGGVKPQGTGTEL